MHMLSSVTEAVGACADEVDGFGNSKFMDDANVPSLLSLPYLGYCARDEPTYTRTRRRLELLQAERDLVVVRAREGSHDD